MVEDMKGKIRVFARARPLSSTETARGNYSVCKSMDEYTLSVASSRGNKDFQYDHVFMPDSSQENVFEDTNVRRFKKQLRYILMKSLWKKHVV